MFVIEYNKKVIYFAGDTVCDKNLLLETKNKFQNINIILISIGVYELDDGRYIHISL